MNFQGRSSSESSQRVM